MNDTSDTDTEHCMTCGDPITVSDWSRNHGLCDQCMTEML